MLKIKEKKVRKKGFHEGKAAINKITLAGNQEKNYRRVSPSTMTP